MSDNTAQEINFELQQLRALLDHYRPLLVKVSVSRPDKVEVSALGAMLQSFYSGFENIFKRIAADMDHTMPGGKTWHSDLLEAMARPNASRSAVISSPLEDRLWPYL